MSIATWLKSFEILPLGPVTVTFLALTVTVTKIQKSIQLDNLSATANLIILTSLDDLNEIFFKDDSHVAYIFFY